MCTATRECTIPKLDPMVFTPYLEMGYEHHFLKFKNFVFSLHPKPHGLHKIQLLSCVMLQFLAIGYSMFVLLV